ncbi:MAG: GTPase, partial [Patescibacteria group bacterium]
MHNHINKNIPLIVIFGRTNVGKSTLFNRLIGKNQALISDVAGTTRDSNIGQIKENGIKFQLVDTGGIEFIKHALNESVGSKVHKVESKESTKNNISKSVGSKVYKECHEQKLGVENKDEIGNKVYQQVIDYLENA